MVWKRGASGKCRVLVFQEWVNSFFPLNAPQNAACKSPAQHVWTRQWPLMQCQAPVQDEFVLFERKSVSCISVWHQGISLWELHMVVSPLVKDNLHGCTHKTQQHGGAKLWKLLSHARSVSFASPLCVEYLCSCSDKHCQFQYVRSPILWNAVSGKQSCYVDYFYQQKDW